MKNKIFKILISLIFPILFIFGVSLSNPKTIFAVCPLECTPSDCTSTYKPQCRTMCDYCNPPPTAGPTQPTEDITGRVTNPILSDRLKTMPGDIFLNNFLRTGINLILLIGAVIFFFVLTSGGVKWISSSGDKAKLESAQKQISSGLVGLAILFSTFVIMKLIETLFGISLLQFTLPTL